jgi:hypothetical protein
MSLNSESMEFAEARLKLGQQLNPPMALLQHKPSLARQITE